jgi:hypothetical protein
MQPPTVTITTQFTRGNSLPVQGLVRFTPSRLWVMHDGIAWACLAPEVELAADGSFSVEVTPTDTDVVWWRYLVETPAGAWDLSVPYAEAGHTLRELIGVDHPGPRSP